MKNYFITGIGTGVGKTVVSAIIVEALKADYWKPIQAGSLDMTDSDIVKDLISNDSSKFYPETYKFKTPASPHYASEIENIIIDPDKLQIPETSNILVIEGAGGLMVPLSNDFLMIDLIKKINTEVILVSQNYLGSINHTLLSIEVLKSCRIPVRGIVFNGAVNYASEKFILDHTQLPCILNICQEDKINKEMILKYAEKLRSMIF